MNKVLRRSKKWISIVLMAILLLAMVVPQNTKAASEPVSLAKWDFSKGNLIATAGIPANVDKTLSVTGAAVTGYNAGPTQGISVANATPWTGNPSFWKVAVSTKGYENIKLSSKQYSSNTGPRDFKVQYSVDDTNWVDLDGATVTVAANWTSGVLSNVALPSEANDKDVVYVRWLKSSETAANGTALASGGTSRMGLIDFTGTELATTPQPDPDAVPGQGKLVLGDKPLANLSFALKNTVTNQWFDFTTDKDGVFTHNLADGTYKVEGLWVAPTWYPLGITMTISNGLVDGLHALVIDGLNPPESTWNVTGSVKNGTSAFAQLTFSVHNTDGNWYDATTDQDGNFKLQLPDSSYQVDGIWDSAAGKWYQLNQTFTVTGGKLVGAANLQIDVAAVADNVTGTVTAGTTPLGDTVFSIHTATGEVQWFNTSTDANGNYSLRLPAGAYTIDGIWDAKAAKWYDLNKNFTVDGSLKLNIDVLADVVAPNVSGSLKKGADALSDVVFSVHTTTGDVQWYNFTSDENGAFIGKLPNGSYMLDGIWVGAENHWYSLSKEFTVDGKLVLDIDVLGTPVEEKYTLNIMHTNDTHANLDTIAKKASAIKSVRAEKPDALLLDAGDVFSGTLYFNEYKGLADLEFMNLAGYDAMTFGNHEFDMGTEVLANFVKDAAFPLLSANVNFAKDANLKSRFNDSITDSAVGGQIYNGMIKEVNGEKIGIFGLTTAETPTISSPGADVVFENYIEEAQKSVDAFKALGVNKIVALTHLGYNDSLTWDNDLELAAKVEGIDVIVGGHTHVKLDAPVIETTGVEPTVIVQANEYNKFLGTVDVTFDAKGKVIADETSGKLLDIATFTEDAATAQILNTKYKPAIDAKKAQVVGKAAVELVGGNPAARTGETNLGNFIADGMLAKAKTINPDTAMAFQNGGGVRVTLPAGDITLANVFQVLPFGNALAIMDLKGSEIKEALEHSVKTAPATANGAFLQVAGMKFSYDSTKPVGEKVHSIQVNESGTYKALDLTKNYAVATNIFTAKGGDGYTMFAKAYEEGRVSEPGFVDWEMFNEYIEAQPNKTVNPQVEGRITQAVQTFTLNLMHTNDTHANLDNVAKKMSAIKSVRAAKPNALLLDAGDVFSGTLYYNEYKGLADLEFMNLAGYDAMTFGNHEFDMGTGVLANFVEDAGFPLLSANVNFAEDANLQSRFNDSITANAEDGQIYNGMIKVVNGEKIGIFGLTTAETPTISSPGAGVVFENYIAEAQKSVDAFKAQGVNKIVALSHLGYNDSLTWDNDLELAAQVEGIDVIVGGHTHVKLDAPVIETTGIEPTVIVQANEYNKFLGVVDVTFDGTGKVITDKTTGSLLDIATFTEDAATAQILNTKYKPAVDEKKATVVGTAGATLVGGNPPARVGETNLGNFIADGMLAKAKTINPNTVMAFQNGGGVRTTLQLGDITLANVFTVLPFGNALAIMDLKGSEIKEALEHSVKTAPAVANGAFLQVSGMTFTYDSTKPVGEKVQSILVKGQDGTYTALDLTKNYSVATNIFTAKGGDGYTMFAKAYEEGRVSEPGFVDWEMFVEYIEAQPNKVVSPQVEGRIINIAPQVVSAGSFSGTEANPKVYSGNVTVDLTGTTGVTVLEYATVKGNLTIKGSTEVDLSNVTVDGDTLFED